MRTGVKLKDIQRLIRFSGKVVYAIVALFVIIMIPFTIIFLLLLLG